MDDSNPLGVAIVGMSCRLPGASSPGELWSNLRDGRESIERWSPGDARDAEVPPELAARPSFVRARALAEDIEAFDAAFFGYSPAEAALIDPQQRFFLECCWEALEEAACIAPSPARVVGVFGGAALSTYLLLNVAPHARRRGLDPLQVNLGNAESFLTTRVSYKLDLRGPSHAVSSACSTSLVAVHLACQSLLNRECDVALAGGVSINLWQRYGYEFIDGGILSRDGRCRPFEQGATGIVFGAGCGVVALRRLEDALAEHADIYAVIRGSAINNDGAQRVGYTAPSTAGQAEVIAEALAAADVQPRDVTYVEAHGTGTSLGDPIEVGALAKALGPAESRPAGVLGSLKGNLGHLDAAAGVAGLIKVALMLRHEELVPSLNCATPNATIDWQNAGFRVQRVTEPWPSERPRIAGVSSFGMGGTNAHAILERARPPALPVTDGPFLLLLSARSESALQSLSEQTAARLEQETAPRLSDVAYTLAAGRRRFAHRRALVTSDHRSAAAELHGGSTLARVESAQQRPVVFMFPGQGTQHPGMAAAAYRRHGVFREALDSCLDTLARHTEVDLRRLLLGDADPGAAALLDQTRNAQPALFAVEYALAKLWQSWGVTPTALIGHSLGELVAACIAGVFELRDALALAVFRGALMQQQPAGAMLSAGLCEEAAREWVDEEIELAAVNAPELCTFAGPEGPIDALARRLDAAGVRQRRLHTSHAFHSRSMQPADQRFAERVSTTERQAPRVSYASNVTGRLITAEEAMDPAAWGRQLREPVRFAAGLSSLSIDRDPVWLEVGPAGTLSTFARATLTMPVVVQSSGDRRDAGAAPSASLERAAAQLWLAGVEFEAWRVNPDPTARRCSLPTHPFERSRCWIDVPDSLAGHPHAAAAVSLNGAADHDGSNAARPLERRATSAAYAAPTTADERRLTTLWEEVLGLTGIGIDDDFFELGGHSLLATTLVGRMRDQYDKELPLQRLFEAPTIRQCARLLAEADGEASSDEQQQREFLLLLAAMTDEEAERELEERPEDAAAQTPET